MATSFWEGMDANELKAYANVMSKSANAKRWLISVLPLAYGDPNQACFWGSMGIAGALVLANFGSAYGTAKAG